MKDSFTWISKTVVVILVGVTVWEGASQVFGIREFVFPSPTAIAGALWEYRDSLVEDTFLSLFESLAGFLIAAVASFILGLLVIYLPSLRGSVISAAVVLKSVPIVILAPIFLVWFGYGLIGKLLLAAIITFFPLLIAFVQGISAVSRAERDLFAIHHASKWQTTTKLLIPRSVPFVLAGLRVAAPMAVLGSLIAETAGARKGLGVTMMIASANFNSRLLFAAAVLSAGLGLMAFELVVVVEKLSERYLEQ
jgi:NitT/TauT family transport system permease protein